MFTLQKTRRQSPATRGRRLAFEVLERREVLSGAWNNAWLPANGTGDQQGRTDRRLVSDQRNQCAGVHAFCRTPG